MTRDVLAPAEVDLAYDVHGPLPRPTVDHRWSRSFGSPAWSKLILFNVPNWVVARRHRVVLDDPVLIGHHRKCRPVAACPSGACPPPRPCAGCVPAPPERRADQQSAIVTGMGDRDGVVPAGFTAHDVDRDQTRAHDATQQWRAQQLAGDQVCQALGGQGLRPRARGRPPSAGAFDASSVTL